MQIRIESHHDHQYNFPPGPLMAALKHRVRGPKRYKEETCGREFCKKQIPDSKCPQRCPYVGGVIISSEYVLKSSGEAGTGYSVNHTRCEFMFY